MCFCYCRCLVAASSSKVIKKIIKKKWSNLIFYFLSLIFFSKSCFSIFLIVEVSFFYLWLWFQIPNFKKRIRLNLCKYILDFLDARRVPPHRALVFLRHTVKMALPINKRMRLLSLVSTYVDTVYCMVYCRNRWLV